jgi:hypothetical protein
MSRFVRLLVLLSSTTILYTAGTAYPQQAAPAAGTTGVTLDYGFFKSEVLPVFAKKREGRTPCIACHGSPYPTGRLHIDPPDANGTWPEAKARQAFQATGRLVVPGKAKESRLLVHPLRKEAGGDAFHFGGRQFMSTNDPDWQILYRWVMGEKARS